MTRIQVKENLKNSDREINTEKLILGAGNVPDLKVINHDLKKHHNYIDVAWDLNKMPWPWEDDQFSFIEAKSVFEHIKNYNVLECLNECWRIAKPLGKMFVKLPYWNCERTWRDPTHLRGFSINSLDYIDPTTKIGNQYSFYTDRKWKILHKDWSGKAHTGFAWNIQKFRNKKELGKVKDGK